MQQRAHAAHADDLAGHVDELEAVEQRRRSSSRVALYWSEEARAVCFGLRRVSVEVHDERRLPRRCAGVPSTISVSLPAACRLSRVRALARHLLGELEPLALTPSAAVLAAGWHGPCRAARRRRRASTTRRARASRRRRSCARGRSARRRARSRGPRPRRRPLLRPASTKLAARRLRSHSNGPGSVSSKSLTSKSSSRSGEP